MTRTELINMFIKMHGFTSYLEIGTQNAANNFDKINVKVKISVDPDPKAEATFICTSDEFFKQTEERYKLDDFDPSMEITGTIKSTVYASKEIPDTFKKVRIGQHNKRRRFIVSDKEDVDPIDITSFDLIFIDGLHEATQVERDIINSIKSLNYKGIIVLHDCNPPTEKDQLVPRQHKVWYGDVWRAFVGFRLKYPDEISFCLDHDCGLGVIVNPSKNIQPGFITDMPWQEFDKNRKQLLGII